MTSSSQNALDKLTDAIFGPITPEFQDFLENQQLIDTESLLSPNAHLTPHYQFEGKISLPMELVRGAYFARELELTKDDVVFTSFPKSGSTWLQAIAFHLKHDGDLKKLQHLNIDHEIPVIEFPECTLEVLKQAPSPRYVKSHLPFSMLPPGNCNRSYKIVTVIRNPKDLIVSTYHFFKSIHFMEFVGDMKDIFNLFINGATVYGPYDKHVLDYWEHRNDPNVLLLTYESMVKDTANQMRKICKFLGKSLNDDQTESLIEATSFTKMATNPNAHHGQWKNISHVEKEKLTFMRKGKTGDWKNHFDDEMKRRVDEWIEEKFGHTDLVFDYN